MSLLTFQLKQQQQQNLHNLMAEFSAHDLSYSEMNIMNLRKKKKQNVYKDDDEDQFHLVVSVSHPKNLLKRKMNVNEGNDCCRSFGLDHCER